MFDDPDVGDWQSKLDSIAIDGVIDTLAIRRIGEGYVVLRCSVMPQNVVFVECPFIYGVMIHQLIND